MDRANIKGYSESSLFVHKLVKGTPLNDGRYSDSNSFVKKILAMKHLKAREDLDENY